MRPTAQPHQHLGPDDIGFRVVIRRQLPAGGLTDALGVLVACDADALVLRRSDGVQIAIEPASIRAAKRVPPGPARVRPARVSDAAGIETLRIRCWRSAYRGMIPDAFLDAMPAAFAVGLARRKSQFTDPTPGIRQLVADAAGTVVGWVAAGPSRDADRPGSTAGEIYACYVAPEWSGVGLGGRLLRRVLRGLADDGRSDLSLWVLADNEPARRFYASHGFAPDGEQQTLDLGGPVVEVRCIRR